jgi:hypothetical protein
MLVRRKMAGAVLLQALGFAWDRQREAETAMRLRGSRRIGPVHKAVRLKSKLFERSSKDIKLLRSAEHTLMALLDHARVVHFEHM